MDGSYLTGLRTGAATAIGAQELCRKDSQVLGILGTGLQARTHLLCHLVVHPFQRVVIWGRNRARVEEYLAEMRPQVKVPLQVLPSADAVCAEADVVACAHQRELTLVHRRGGPTGHSFRRGCSNG